MEENKFKKFHLPLAAMLVLVLSFFIQTDDLKSQAFFWGTQLQTGETIVQVSGGEEHFCALFSNGRVKCWGRNQWGELGLGHTNTIGDDESPLSVPYLNIGGFVKQVSVGFEHTCAVTAGGDLKCWGHGGFGKLGYAGGSTSGFVNVGGKVKQVAAGSMHTCALLSEGNVRCWGQAQYGKLGYVNSIDIGDNETPASAGDVNVGAKVKQISLGENHTCALLVDGNVRCWGYAQYGILGHGNTINIGDDESPASAGNLNIGGNVKKIAVGSLHTCALLVDGRVRCWGHGGQGAKGNGTGLNSATTTPNVEGDVSVGGLVSDIYAGAGITCAILADGNIKCWGSNSFGQLGYGNLTTIGDNELPSSVGVVPAVAADGRVIQVAPGNGAACALYSTGKIKCWGKNNFGQLGYADTVQRGDTAATTPDKLGYVGTGGEVRVRSVTATGGKTCAILSTGDLKCWGANSNGDLGYGHTNVIGNTTANLPSMYGKVYVGGKVKQVVGGEQNTCALLETGKVRCWGRNDYGQGGYANSVIYGDNDVPAKAGDISLGQNAIQIASTEHTVCALLESGNVKCWGSGLLGAHGQGYTPSIGDNELPSAVGPINLGESVLQIDGEKRHFCAVLASGNIRCWGDNSYGQLGYDNTTAIGDNELPSSAGPVNLGGMKAIQVAVGYRHTCALLETGNVRCWGEGLAGKLGYGNTNNVGDGVGVSVSSIGDISLGEKVIQIDLGEDHSCALLESGRVKCWGSGWYIGMGNTTAIGDNELPSSVGTVQTGQNVLKISATYLNVCALLESGNVLCWGHNVNGQLGLGHNNFIGDNEHPYQGGIAKLFPQTDADAPPNPTSLTATPVSGPFINLTWQSGGGSTCDYRISYQTGATAPANCATGTTISENLIYSNNYTVTGLAQSTQYSFRVCAINCDVPTPEVSSGITVSATTWQNPPPNPINPTAVATSEFQIDLSWATGGGTTTDYRISYAVGVTAPATCSTGNTIGEGAITGTSHSVTGLVPSTTYTFRICAINGNPTPDESSGVTVVGVTMNPLAPVYRSVGPGNTNLVSCGVTTGGCTGQGNLTISGSTATFATTLTDKFGVGDVIVYDCSGNNSFGSGDCLAFIHGRTNITNFTVKTYNGLTPTAFAADADWRLYRAYTSLSDAEAGIENSAITAIDASLGDFDSWSGGYNLTTANLQWNIVLYSDAADTGGMTVDGWTLDATRWLKVYAPNSLTETALPLRHSGVWDNFKSRIVVANQNALRSINQYVYFEGLQISVTADGSDSAVVVDGGNSRVIGNLIKFSSTSTGGSNKAILVNTGTNSIANNMIYLEAGGTCDRGISLESAGTHYVYNNSVIGCTTAIQQASGTAVAKNNLVQSSTNDYVGTFDPTSTNNLSHLTNAPGSSPYNSQSPSFIKPSVYDFRLSSADTAANDRAVNLSADLNFPFTTDTAGTPRGTDGFWDVGAHEAATPIYRSVGPSNTEAVACGVTVGTCTGQGNLTISGSTATFASNVPLNVGLGDVIIYDCNTNGSLGAGDCVAFIHGRTSATVYTVRTNQGQTPTAFAANNQWSIYRAYTSIASALQGGENSALWASTLSNFDTYWNGKNIVNSNEQWNVVLYADAVDTSSTAVYVDKGSYWVTSSANYIRIFTPTESTEVGFSQRHSGTWDSYGYTLSVTTSTAGTSAIDIQTQYVRVDGLKISTSDNTNNDSGIRVWPEYGMGPSEIYISNNIIRSSQTAGLNQSGIRIEGTGNGQGPMLTTYIYNNIIYADNGGRLGVMEYTGGSMIAYNNTVSTGGSGFQLSAGNYILKNNIVQNSGASNAYWGAFNPISNNNLSDDGTNTGGAQDRINKTVQFQAAASGDYRLSLSDIEAADYGADLSADSLIAFNKDITGAGRGNDEAWDIGAHEVATPIYRSVGPGNTSELACGVTVGACFGQGNLTISGSTATFASAVPLKVGVGDVIVYDCNTNGSLGAGDCVAFIHGRTSTTVYTVKNAAGITPTAYAANDKWRIYRAYTSFNLAESGTENTSISSINATLGDFDGWTNGKNIFSNNEQWNIALYDDGVDTNWVLAGWTTSENNFIKIFTPVNSSEVGFSQRHFGYWGTTGYSVVSAASDKLVNISDFGNIKIEGVRFSQDWTGANGVGIFLNSYNIQSKFILDIHNNIIRLTGNGTGTYNGIELFWTQYNSNVNSYISNNIIYTTNRSAFGVFCNTKAARVWAYNNTIAGNIDSGIVNYVCSFTAKNNIVQNSSPTSAAYSGSFLAGSNYNLGDDAFTTGGANDRANKTVTFLNAATGDYRLSPNDVEANDTGTNLSADSIIAFNTDIVGVTRGTDGAWDIGASEAATPIFRSVGPGNTNVLACGATVGACTGTGNLTISGSTATFVNTFAKNIGVGDAIVYDCSANASLGAGDCIAFIHGRTNAKNFTVKNAAGLTPTAYAAGAQWRIYRAYINLWRSHSGNENSAIAAIDATLGNFDGTGGSISNLLTSNTQWNIAMYADAVEQTTSRTGVGSLNSVSGTNFVKVYTPYLLSEVGQPQRHFGVWSSTGYTIACATLGAFNNVLDANGSVVIDGLQIDVQDNVNGAGAILTDNNVVSQKIISNNLIRFSHTSGANHRAIYPYFSGASETIYLINNIIYSTAAGTWGIWLGVKPTRVYAYNNTFVGIENPFYTTNGSDNILAINNLIQNSSANAFAGSFLAGSDYNLSDDATTAGGSNNRTNNTTVAFVDAANQDYRLALTDTQAKGFGANLSADANYPFTNDIGMLTRTAPWDIGASKPVPNYPNANNLAGYWPLDEAAGNFIDYSGNALDAVPGGAPQQGQPGVVGLSAKFDNFNDSANFKKASMPSMNFGMNSVTFSHWINPSSFVPKTQGQRYAQAHYCVGANAMWSLTTGNSEGQTSTIGANLHDGTVQVTMNSGAGAVRTNTWNHVVVVYDRDYNLGQIYVNGVASGTSYSMATMVNAINCSSTTGVAHFGEGNSFGFDGKLDEFAIWSRALTPTEISEIYQKQRPRPSIEISNASISEGQNAVLTVRIPSPVSWDITFNWTTVDGSANAGSDYTANSGTGITIPAGSTSVTLANIVTNNDGNGDPDETFQVSLSNIVGATAGITTGTVRLREGVPVNNEAIIISSPVINNITSTSFDVQITYADDSDNDGAVKFYYCNYTDTGSCDPVTGTNVDMNRGAGVFTVSVSGLPTSFNGDTLNYKIIATDPDGVYGSAIFGQINLVLDAPTPIFRSVGRNNTNPLACGVTSSPCTGQGNMGIAGSTATFASAVQDKVGVGDAIVYDCNSSGGLGAGDCVAFIYERLSNTSYTVKNNVGGTPTAYASNNQWRIYRAYTLANSAMSLTENASITGINATLGNFDDSALEIQNTKAKNTQWNFALYADAKDTTPVSSGSWLTAPGRFVKLFTPVLPSEVGVSQRHTGEWTDPLKAYTLNTGSGHGISMDTNYMIVDGLQIEHNYNFDNIGGITWADRYVGDRTVSNNIIIDVYQNAGKAGIYLTPNISGGTDTVKIFNNFIYGFSGSQTATCLWIDLYAQIYAYNNTCYHSGRGFYKSASGTPPVLKNNISQLGLFGDYVGTFSASSTNNLSQDASAPGTNPQINKTVSFINPTAIDLRLSTGDTAAKNQGTNLSADPNLPITTDLTGGTYGLDGTWDIGAAEADANDILISNLVNSSPSNTGFTTTINYAGDANANATMILYYCNETDSPTCTPTTSLGSMTRVGATYTITVAGLSNPNDPGDRLKLRATATDVDGAAESPLDGYVYLGTHNPPMLTTQGNLYIYKAEVMESADLGSDGTDDLDLDAEAITYTCYYDTTVDGTVNHLTASQCSQANINNGTGFNFDSATGVISGWSPASTNTYEFEIKGCDAGSPSFCNFTNVFKVRIFEHRNFKKFATGIGTSHQCGIASDGKGYCWGNDGNGRLGDSLAIASSNVPVPIDNTNIGSIKDFIDITVSNNGSCGITSDGKGYCWGRDGDGMLGNGGIDTDSGIPVAIDMSPLNSGAGFTQIVAGSYFYCALSSDGFIYCWGDGSNLSLGNGDNQDKIIPTQVSMTNLTAGSRFTSVVAGNAHTCGIASDGKAYCWGSDTFGQLGNGAPLTSLNLPQLVSTANLTAGTNFRSLSFGFNYNCGIASDGKSFCWGDDSAGQLGYTSGSSHVTQSLPVTVNLLNLASGTNFIYMNNRFGLANDGKTYSWGYDAGNGGTYKDGLPELELLPTEIDLSDLSRGTSLLKPILATNHSFSTANDGIAYSWGYGYNGELANGSSAGHFFPKPIITSALTEGEKIISISMAGASSAAISSAGRVYVWGKDNWGQLGENADGDNANEPTYVRIDNSMLSRGVSFVSVFQGDDHSHAITNEGVAYAWGRDDNGRLGENADGDNLQENIPTIMDTSALTAGSSFVTFAKGWNHSCGLASDGKMFCWGRDTNGQLGENADADNLDENIPVAVDLTNLTAGSNFVKIYSGFDHTCGIASDGKTYCWGLDGNGQLGDGGANTDQNIPVLVDISNLAAGDKFVSLALGRYHTCGITGQGKTYCWGADTNGQLGENADGDNLEENIPVEVTMTNVTAGASFTMLTGGESHTCGITNEGKAYCWGIDSLGQLGEDADGDNLDENIPVEVNSSALSAGSRFIQIDSGYNHSCGLSSEGKVYCWGRDAFGQLGDDSNLTDQNIPVPIAFP